jgi:hypothetical protein
MAGLAHRSAAERMSEALVGLSIERAMTGSPNSLAAEEALLGSLLIDSTAFAGIAETVDVPDFFREDHRLIFAAMTALVRADKPIDLVTVERELQTHGDLDKTGGLAYLGRLANETPSAFNIGAYAQIVLDCATKRRLKDFADGIAALCGTGELSSLQVLTEIEKQLGSLQARSLLTSGRRPTLKAIEVHDFLALDIPPRQFLLRPILPQQGLAMVYGPRGLGKTKLSVGIAVAVSSGAKFLKWSAPEPAGVLLIDGEMPAVAMQRRLADAIQASDGEVRAPLNIISPDLNCDAGMPDLSTLEGQKAVDALITEDIRLIILDNLSSLLRTGVENDAESWLPLQTWALRHRAAGRSVLFIHHAGKGGAQRGTSRREDVLDTVIALRRPSDYRASEGARFEVHIEKGRSLFGSDANPFEAQLTADAQARPVWTIKQLELAQENQIEEMSSLGMKAAEIADELGCSKATVYRRMQRKANGHDAKDPNRRHANA